jgi:hypothetical protein
MQRTRRRNHRARVMDLRRRDHERHRFPFPCTYRHTFLLSVSCAGRTLEPAQCERDKDLDEKSLQPFLHARAGPGVVLILPMAHACSPDIVEISRYSIRLQAHLPVGGRGIDHTIQASRVIMTAVGQLEQVQVHYDRASR